jgi:hypothetical protein
MRDAPMRNTPIRQWSMGDARLWDSLCKKHAYERRAYVFF